MQGPTGDIKVLRVDGLVSLELGEFNTKVNVVATSVEGQRDVGLAWTPP